MHATSSEAVPALGCDHGQNESDNRKATDRITATVRLVVTVSQTRVAVGIRDQLGNRGGVLRDEMVSGCVSPPAETESAIDSGRIDLGAATGADARDTRGASPLPDDH